MEPQQPRSSVFRFSDPRQQRIYEELKEVVGPGPAAFFHDACWLMTYLETLHTTAHLVAHLLRELESTIRAVFKPVAEGVSQWTNGSGSQKDQIKSILAALNIDEKASEAKAWFELADRLHGLAHRRGLDAPRQMVEIEPLWNQIQNLLDIILVALREHFITWIGILDELLTKPQPIKTDLKQLAQEIPNNQVTRQYFFERLQFPEWLEPLRAKGFFQNPLWPEARYLARMAKHKSNLVAEIIQEMEDTENDSVISDLVDALLAMPQEVSTTLVEEVARWAKSPYLLLPEKLGQLLAHWAKGGGIEEALRVSRVLLDVLPDDRRMEFGPDEVYRLPPEPRARFDVWHYEQILKEHYPDFVREAGLIALELLCDLLEKAITYSRHHDDDDHGPLDHSYIWRPAIEEHSQNLGDTIKDSLVSAVRDAAELLVRSKRATVEEVVNALERRRWKVFQRFALHILRIFSSRAGELAALRLTDRSLFEDVCLRHEYVLLLREHFSRLTLEDQSRILGWVEDGPEVNKWKQWRESETGSLPSDEDAACYQENWQRDWLARIGSENLPGEWQKRYRELVEKHGEPEHPEFSSYTEGGWAGPTSPKTADELKAMSVTEIVEFLKRWKPLENVFGEPSPEGLGRLLSSVVADDPRRFAIEAKVFQGLDPTYVRAVMSGLREAVKQERAFDWGPVLDLCDWVLLSQPREIEGRKVQEMVADQDWGWTRKAIADLLSIGFENRRSCIPIGFRHKVWNILKPLTDDPDPTPEQEQRYGGSDMDTATLSINTTRGQAMHAVVLYALWVRRHLEKKLNPEVRLQKGFHQMPEVREVLEMHLDPAREPSLAIRTVYGRWFPWLAFLDPDWTHTHTARIFPQDVESEAFFEASWSTYLRFCIAYDDVWDMLKPYYRLAADRLAIQGDDEWQLAYPNKKLAEHLMVFYWRGKISLDDSIFSTFWQNAADGLRTHAISFIGRSLKQTNGDISAEILDRLKRLWKWRLAAAKKARRFSAFEKEIAALGWWFVSKKFDVGWAISQLSESLKLVHKTDPNYLVLEQLTIIVQTLPLESVVCLRMIAEGDHEGWTISRSRDHVRRILEVGLQHPSAADEAERVIHYLGSRGFLEFRNLLEIK